MAASGYGLPIAWDAVEQGLSSRFAHVRGNCAYLVMKYRYDPLADKVVDLVNCEDDYSIVAGADAAVTFGRTSVLPRLREIGELANPDVQGQIPRAIAELEALERTKPPL